MKIIKISKKNVAYKTSWTAVLLPKNISEKIYNFGKKIPEREIYLDEDGSKGLEDQHHVTIQYGIHSIDSRKVKNLFKDEAGGKVKLGKLSIFENEKYDVLKISITAPKLHAFKKKILNNINCDNKFPQYVPHATIAYLQPGAGKKYIDRYSDKFEGLEFEFDTIVFRSKGVSDDIEIYLSNKSENKK